MELGAFSVSLAVDDLAASQAFYEALGFEAKGGDPAQGWCILRNGETTLGLFQGMFEGNLLTFNPGWDRNANPVDDFTDVREIQARLKAAGIEPVDGGTDPDGTGVAHISVVDPDGNVVLLDQHVPKPTD